MDYRHLIEDHLRTGADVSLCVLPVTAQQSSELGILKMEPTGRITRFSEKPQDPELVESLKIDVEAWKAMDDETIIAELVGIRGIGRWTAEMFLIFHLMRPNVLPLDDVGLINGISQNYFSGDAVSRSDARDVAVAWTPYCSVATWYIWRSLDPLPVAY